MKQFVKEVLVEEFGDLHMQVFDESPLLQYLDMKMGVVYGDSKTRRSLANIYAIYSMTYFYERDFYNDKEAYRKFDGYEYMKLFSFYRSLYGGEKLQNHALNSRVNGEFVNKVSGVFDELILANNGRYALHIKYLYVGEIDLSHAVNALVEKYIDLLRIKDSELLKELSELANEADYYKKIERIGSLLTENTEARIFEIVSYAILKSHYWETEVFIGFSESTLTRENLTLYKTGRTNANDGGIDFVMKPLGRFFQVTEVDNYDKYLLDIDKVMHFPITFVIRTERDQRTIRAEIDNYVEQKSGGMQIIKNRYKDAIEEIITINELQDWLSDIQKDDIDTLIKDIEVYYSLEMNLLESSVIYPKIRDTGTYTYELRDMGD